MTNLLIFVVFFAVEYSGLTITTTACDHSIWAALAWCIFTSFVSGAMTLCQRKRDVPAPFQRNTLDAPKGPFPGVTCATS